MKNLKIQKNKAFSIVEVVVACAIISVTVLALMSTAGKSIQVSNQTIMQSQATLLIEEGVEAVKSIRDNNWTNISGLTNSTNYYLFFYTTTNQWSLITSQTAPNGSIPTYPIDGAFTRNVVFSSVYRNASNDIANSGTLDTGTKKVTVTVSWNKPGGVASKNLSFYISNIFN